MKLNLNLLRILKEIPLEIDKYIVLYYAYNTNLDDLLLIDSKYIESCTVLENLGFIENNKITSSGKKLYESINKLKEESEIFFKEFWETYPINDAWGTFSMSRIIRSNITLTKQAYMRALKYHTHDEIMVALLAYIDMLKHKSSSTENKLKYMKSPKNFLNDDLSIYVSKAPGNMFTDYSL